MSVKQTTEGWLTMAFAAVLAATGGYAGHAGSWGAAVLLLVMGVLMLVFALALLGENPSALDVNPDRDKLDAEMGFFEQHDGPGWDGAHAKEYDLEDLRDFYIRGFVDKRRGK